MSDKMTNPTVKEIVKENGYGGLCDCEDEPCGCFLNDLIPCGTDNAINCKAGYAHKLTKKMFDKDPENWGELQIGDDFISLSKEI